jgi:hypothetical protein
MTVAIRTNGKRWPTRLQSSEAIALAVRRRRESMRRERLEQVRLAEMLARYLDPELSFWSCVENKPRSKVSGAIQRRAGVKSGFPDLFVAFRRKRSPRCPTRVVCIELKSHSGLASPAQKEIRLEMVKAGVRWWMARSARSALAALYRSGVPFRRPWRPPQLERWEGPWEDPTQRLPQHPAVAAQRRAARQRWLDRQRARDTAKLAAEGDEAAGFRPVFPSTSQPNRTRDQASHRGAEGARKSARNCPEKSSIGANWRFSDENWSQKKEL